MLVASVALGCASATPSGLCDTKGGPREVELCPEPEPALECHWGSALVAGDTAVTATVRSDEQRIFGYSRGALDRRGASA